MGVWAAESIAAKEDFFIDAAIAVNGTPIPVHDEYGIPSKTAWATHDGLTSETLNKFYRRVFGGAGLHKKMERVLPEASDVEELKSQLFKIYNDAPEGGRIKWNMAVISEEDKIFPPVNLKHYWEGRCQVNTIKAPHYPFHLIERWEDIVHEW